MSFGSGAPDVRLAGEDGLRRVSLIAPCRNEREHVEGFVQAALAQQLPPGWALELIVADGRSDDGSRARLDALAVEEPRLVVLDNPGQIVSTGLNAAIAQARGEVLVRLDLHTDYAADYVANCLRVLAQTQADNVGGPWHAEGLAPTQRAVAAVFQSRWLAGGARSRQLDYSGWVDTVYLGAWPRASFERFGCFDENLVRNQDDEHNLRLVKGGGRIWQDASIRSTYRPRGTVARLFRQYLQYGYWKPWVMRKHGQAAALRQLVPGAFVAALLAALGLWLLGGPRGPLRVLAGGYAGLVVVASCLLAREAGIALLPRLPAVIAAYHLGYGLGTLLGWADLLSGARGGRRRFAGLTR